MYLPETKVCLCACPTSGSNNSVFFCFFFSKYHEVLSCITYLNIPADCLLPRSERRTAGVSSENTWLPAGTETHKQTVIYLKINLKIYSTSPDRNIIQWNNDSQRLTWVNKLLVFKTSSSNEPFFVYNQLEAAMLDHIGFTELLGIVLNSRPGRHFWHLLVQGTNTKPRISELHTSIVTPPCWEMILPLFRCPPWDINPW